MSKPRVMIVDDEPFYSKVLDNLLREDYDVVAVDSGEAALAALAETPLPELILLDVMMPGIDGYETCARLKADNRSADIPVIFLTVKSDVDDELKGFELGAVDYITKPMSPPIVKARVRTHVGLARIRQQLQAMLETRVS